MGGAIRLHRKGVGKGMRETGSRGGGGHGIGRFDVDGIVMLNGVPGILRSGIDGVLIVLVLDRSDVRSSVVVVRRRFLLRHFVRSRKVESRVSDRLRMGEVGSTVEAELS